LAKAEAEANKKKISISNAICEIIERADDPELIIKAFTRIEDTISHAAKEKAAMAAYLDASA
jgi:hypothetical protein